MKKKLPLKKAAARLTAGIAAAGTLLLPRCSDFDPFSNVNENVYGPPPDDVWSESENVNEAVYGPPEWFEGDNVEEPVYGPPSGEDFDPAEMEPEDVYGPPPSGD